MKRLLAFPFLLLPVSLALAVDVIPREDTLKVAFVIAADLKRLQDTPIPTEVDLKYAVALREGDHGALLLPEAKLDAKQIAKPGKEILPLGQMWLRKLTVMRSGEPAGHAKLRLVPITYRDQENTAAVFTLGVRTGDNGAPELVLLSKDKTPLATAPLKKIEAKQQFPLEADAVEEGGASARVTLKILGQYEAEFQVAELDY